MWFEFASGQIQGKRAAQEDAVEVLARAASRDAAPGCAERLLVAMADGMGGHVGGRIASSIVSRRFLESLGSEAAWTETAEQALLTANLALRTATEKRPELDGMGSTLVGVEVSAAGLSWISVGDTGLFLLSADGYARLNEDHSFGAYLDEQAEKGLITPEAAAQDRRRNQLFHALLGDPIDHFERRATPRPLVPGDIVVLATDGLKTLDDDVVGAYLRDSRDAAAADLVVRLLEAVEREDRPRQDNATVVVVRVRDGDMPDAPSISRIVSPFMLSQTGDTTVEMTREGDFATQMIRPPVRDTAEIGGAPAPMLSVRTPEIEPLTRANLILLIALGVLSALLIGVIWYVISP